MHVCSTCKKWEGIKATCLPCAGKSCEKLIENEASRWRPVLERLVEDIDRYRAGKIKQLEKEYGPGRSYLLGDDFEISIHEAKKLLEG